MSIIDQWIDFIEDHAKVIFILVPDAADAFVIFETLNDRGLDLTIADLTKVYLFGRAGKRIDELRAAWNHMTGTLAAFNESDITKTYIHQLWSSYHGVTRDKEVFSEIRKEVRGETAAANFGKQLSDNVRLYYALRNSDSETWDQYGPNARMHIAVLNKSLRVSQVRTLLLAVMATFEKAEIRKLLPYVVAWSVRFLVAGGSPGNLESYYATRAVKVRKRELPDAESVIKSMVDLVPNDAQFRAAFATESNIPEHRARYYLACLARVEGNEPNRTLRKTTRRLPALNTSFRKRPIRRIGPCHPTNTSGCTNGSGTSAC